MLNDGRSGDGKRQGAYPEKQDHAQKSTETDPARQKIGERKAIDGAASGRMLPVPGRRVSVISEKMKQRTGTLETGQMPESAIRRIMREEELVVRDNQGNVKGDLSRELLRHRWFTKPVVAVNDRLLLRCKTKTAQ